MGTGVGLITAAIRRKVIPVNVNGNGSASCADHAAHHEDSSLLPSSTATSHPPPSNGYGHSSSNSNSPYLTLSKYGSASNNSVHAVPSPDGISRVYSSSPERVRRDSTNLLNCVPEDVSMEFAAGQEEETTLREPHYTGGRPLDDTEDDDEDEAEAEWELDEELEEHGLYRGPYKRLLALYTFVPLTFILTFAFLACLPGLAYHTYPESPNSYPYAPYLPFPIPELLTATALWCFGYLLRDPLYALITSSLSLSLPISLPSHHLTLSLHPAIPPLIATAIYTFVSIVLQQSSLPLLLVPHHMLANHPTPDDPAFRRVWWIALGWAAAEAIVAIRQGYDAIALYRDVLVTVRRTRTDDDAADIVSIDVDVERGDIGGGSRKSEQKPLPLDLLNGSATSPASPRDRDSATPRAGNSAARTNMNSTLDEEGYGRRADSGDAVNETDRLLPPAGENGQTDTGTVRPESALKMQVDHDIDQLITLKSREELEEMYGMPVVRIPVFLSCLQRVNALLLSLGICLLLSHAYIHSTLGGAPALTKTDNTILFVTLPLVWLVQFVLAVLHTPLVLPRFGVPTVVYTGSMVSLGSFFAGLGVWGALS